MKPVKGVKVMAGYVERLSKDATMGGVFDDLYGRAETAVAELRAMQEWDGTGTPPSHVPGTPLEFGLVTSANLHTTHIRVNVGNFGANLVSVTTHQVPSRKQLPRSVRANRGREVSGDYWLRTSPSGLIRCHLGKMGRLGAQMPEDELLGENDEPGDQRVSKLPLERRQRLGVVAQGILTNLRLVERLAIGANPEEVLVAAGKVLER